MGRRDGARIRLAAGTGAGQAVHCAAEVGGLARRAVRQSGRHHPGLQAKRAQGVELVP